MTSKTKLQTVKRSDRASPNMVRCAVLGAGLPLSYCGDTTEYATFRPGNP
ncbi:uncharacterized protein PHALS_08465 [Plasmopara halstedii]|uniref:Uncharacterized protein n=1 Tax=Plasmopara halstedii TaxID=4781 RepID=A0A0N7L4D7_PLAHL|nr:uncharacterized protein PHALS_08465 [Plasmopara halstedii]CEG38387.1 hypothetical protein PHALS_08465 [Plasmopara halstedii]|eukprot:XP_024574756.1 hypothetical protein PHALS_08465 [Plasmopara halstedii]